MKPTAPLKPRFFALALAAALPFATQPAANAGDGRAAAAIGGFISGALVGSAVGHHSHHGHKFKHGHKGHHDFKGHHDRGRHRGSFHRGDRHGHGHSFRHDRDYRSRGHYKIITKRKWVPGRFVYKYDDYGNKIRVWRDGHYTTSRKKIWVPHGHSRHYRSRSHSSFSFGFSYGCPY